MASWAGLGKALGGALPLIGAGVDYASQMQGNKARRKEAQRDRDFQERMRNTEWQAGVADMEAAGLNPALAYQQGGASSPSGAMAQQENIGEGSVGNAMAVKTQQQNLRLMKAQEVKVIAEGHTARSDQNIREVEEREAAARRRYYFNANGTMTEAMKALVEQQHLGRMGSSAQQVHAAAGAKFGLSEQEMISNLFESMKTGGAGAKTFGPLLIALMAQARRK